MRGASRTPPTDEERHARSERSPGPSSLDTLLGQRLGGRYARFFDTSEGIAMPNGEEEQSGLVLDESGRVFSYWLGWDSTLGAPALTVWEQVEPEPTWLEHDEYREARQALGLPVAQRGSPPRS